MPTVPPGVEEEEINNGGDNAEGPDQDQQQPQQQQQQQQTVECGAAGDNVPNALTYSSIRKHNKRQHEREKFQNKLLETLQNDGKNEEQDGTELAMLAMVKKIKRNLTADQQEDLIDESQQVVSRFCRDVKQKRSVPTATIGSANQVQVIEQPQQMMLQPYNPGTALDEHELADLHPVSFKNM